MCSMQIISIATIRTKSAHVSRLLSAEVEDVCNCMSRHSMLAEYFCQVKAAFQGGKAAFYELLYRSLLYSKEKAILRPAVTMDTMLMSLMRMFRDGPEVSLKGSPTVSPTTEASCTAVCLPQ